MRTIYILKADDSGTLRSIDEPVGFAVTNEEEAKKFVAEASMGYTHSYEKVLVFDTWEEGCRARFGKVYKKTPSTGE